VLDDALDEPPSRPAVPAANTPLLDGQVHDFDPSSIRVNQLSSLLALGIFAIISLPILLGLFFAIDGEWTKILVLAWTLLIAFLAARALIWPPIAYRHAHFQLDDHGLTLWRGVLWRSVQRVPRNRVQHTDVTQGPIARIFGLATLTLFTAGNHYAAVSVPGLRHEDAVALRDHLLPDHLLPDSAGDAV
jgi:uncharacterized protein